jgi:hypothetical protein
MSFTMQTLYVYNISTVFFLGLAVSQTQYLWVWLPSHTQQYFLTKKQKRQHLMVLQCRPQYNHSIFTIWSIMQLIDVYSTCMIFVPHLLKYSIRSNLNIFYIRKNNETNLKIEENQNTFHCDQRFQASSRT